MQRTKAFIFGFILMFGFTSSTLLAQESTSDAEETTTQTKESDEITAEFFGEEYNREELAMLQKLSPEQLKEYLMHKEQMDLERRSSIDWEDLVIAPLIVATVFMTPVLIVGFLMYFSYQEKKLVHASIAKMVEKGMEIPTHLLTQQKKIKEFNPNADLKKALILMSIGLGVSLFFFTIPDAREEGAWAIGMVPFVVGLGYLTFWSLDKPRRESSLTSLSE